jgi:hypothetical protein
MKECIAKGELVDRPDLLAGMEDITELMGYARVSALEAELLRPEDLEKKYGGGARDYVIGSKGKA